MPILDPNPPLFCPTGQYTQECKDELDAEHPGLLMDAKCTMMHDLTCKQNLAFAWDNTEHGCLHLDFFPPIDLTIVKHIPWIERNIPIPPGIYCEVCDLIKTKIAAGVYEPSNSAYRSR
ncbi:hypothetical protein DXG03_006821, partial [Asterophora parasitica]